MLGRFRGALLGVVLLTVALPASASLIRVSQESAPGAGDFNSNILGFVTSHDGSGQTAAQIYAYGANNSYNGTIVPAVNNTQQTFFVRTSTGLAFFHILDAIGGGLAGTGALLFTVSNDTVSVLVQDDAGEIVLGGGGTTVTGTFTFGNNAMDGVAFGTLDGFWSVDASNTAAPTGLAGGWRIVGANQTINVSQTVGRRVRFEAVPEPGAITFLAGGLLALAWARRRRAAQR